MIMQDVKAQPVFANVRGRARSPAPTAVAMSVKIDPRILPSSIGPNVLSTKVLVDLAETPVN